MIDEGGSFFFLIVAQPTSFCDDGLLNDAFQSYNLLLRIQQDSSFV